MKAGKFDVVQLVMQPYVLDMLNALNKPKRFSDLLKYVKNRKTLTLKLSKLLKQELIEHYPMKVKEGYANSYIISKKGREIIDKLDRM